MSTSIQPEEKVHTTMWLPKRLAEKLEEVRQATGAPKTFTITRALERHFAAAEERSA